jgi:lysophospholipase L1-like esterase
MASGGFAMFKLFLSLIFAFPTAVFACSQPMPTEASSLKVDDIELGSCWLKETLQSSNKKEVTDKEVDLFERLLSELANYIPSKEQADDLATLLASQRKLPNILRSSVLTGLAQLHVLNLRVRSFVLRAMEDPDEDVRGSAIWTAGRMNPSDPSMQKYVLKSLRQETGTTNRSFAIDGIYIRSEEAVTALNKIANDKSDESLQGQAAAKLKQWHDHPLPEASLSKGMAILGDSISVGFFADTSLLDAPKYKVAPNDLNVAWMLGQSKHDEQIKRVWAGGDKINSHFLRIKAELKAAGKTDDVELHNFARAGATTPNLLGQIAALNSALLLEPNQQLIYVTLFMGSNDVCAGRSAMDIGNHLTRALDRLNRLPSKSKIVVLLSSLPAIHQLGSPLIANYPGLAGLTCEAVQRDHIKFCNAFTAPATPADYEKNQNQLMETNQKIAEVASASQSLKNLQVVLGASPSRADVKPELLAFDCFHPNEQGQQTLADALWNDLLQAGVKW